MMTHEGMSTVLVDVIREIRETREAGRKEYSHGSDDAFANFRRLGLRLGLSMERILLVYLEKHLDGIHAYVGGHTSQREDIRGRINDAIVYLILLRGMVEEKDQEKKEAA